MISKEIDGSNTNNSLKKIRLHRGKYEWADAGVLIRNYGPTMLYLLLKTSNLDTRIGVSNLKYETNKEIQDKFSNNIKDLLDDISSNYSIIIDKGEHHKDYVWHILRDILSGKISTPNYFIEMTKDDWDTGTELTAGELINDATEKYNNTVSAK